MSGTPMRCVFRWQGQSRVGGVGHIPRRYTMYARRHVRNAPVRRVQRRDFCFFLLRIQLFHTSSLLSSLLLGERWYPVNCFSQRATNCAICFLSVFVFDKGPQRLRRPSSPLAVHTHHPTAADHLQHCNVWMALLKGVRQGAGGDAQVPCVVHSCQPCRPSAYHYQLDKMHHLHQSGSIQGKQKIHWPWGGRVPSPQKLV